MRLVVLALAALAAATIAAAGAPAGERTALRLDGVAFEPELALTESARERGLMLRKRAPADGMLFVFPEATSSAFWMKDTLVPLEIVFFDSAGRRVRKLSMTPCRSDPCRIYDPGRSYRFALELPATDARPARTLGPRAELARLARRAG